GGEGDDFIQGGAGDDILFGGPGDDVIHGMDGNDQIDAGTGSDVVIGGSGDDGIAVGLRGHDFVDGGAIPTTLLPLAATIHAGGNTLRVVGTPADDAAEVSMTDSAVIVTGNGGALVEMVNITHLETQLDLGGDTLHVRNLAGGPIRHVL